MICDFRYKELLLNSINLYFIKILYYECKQRYYHVILIRKVIRCRDIRAVQFCIDTFSEFIYFWSREYFINAYRVRARSVEIGHAPTVSDIGKSIGKDIKF